VSLLYVICFYVRHSLGTLLVGGDISWIYSDFERGTKGSRVHFIPLFLVCMRLTWNIARSEPLDEKSFDTLRQTLLAYIQSEYIYGLAESNAPCASSIYPLSWLTSADHLI